MIKSLQWILILSFSPLIVLSGALANDGYFLCTPPEALIDHSLSIEYGRLNYTGLGVTDLAQGKTSKNKAYFALNFTRSPYVIEAHHPEALYQSGQRVFKSRPLELLKSVPGTHSGATLYKTTDLPRSWNLIHGSDRTLSEKLLPKDLNDITRGAAYVLVGRRVALVGFPKQLSPALSLCIKQSEKEEPFSSARINQAFMQLMKDYNDKIKNHQSLEMSSLAFSNDLHSPLDESARESVINILDDFFQNQDLVFRSQHGNILSVGAFLGSTGLLAARLMMKRSNMALAILPPDLVDQYFMIGKAEIYTPEDGEIPFSEIEELFRSKDKAMVREAMKANPRLEAYLHQLAILFHQQTQNSNEI